MEGNSILVPVDGSKNASRAIEVAIDLAMACEARIEFLYVVNLRGAFSEASLAQAGEKSVLENAVELGKKILGEALERTPGGISARGHCVSGEAADAILRTAAEIHSGMIVMGSRGIGALKAAFLGSVSTYVLNHAKCPVVLIKANEEEK